MLAEATRSARAVAEQFALDSHSRRGPIRRANQGVFEIMGPRHRWRRRPGGRSGIDRAKSAARLDGRLLSDQLRLHGGAIFRRPSAPWPSFTLRLHLILLVQIRKAILRLSERRIGHNCQGRFAVSCGIERRRSPTVHRPHRVTRISASRFTLLLAFDAAGRERQCSEPFDRNFSAALLTFP
jgi:hypothetical protein